MDNLTPPCFVRILEPVLPDERGRQLLISINGDVYRVGLRDGSVRSYRREELEEWVAP